MRRCRRCDWAAADDSDLIPMVQLRAHAADSGHPLCPCCDRSLADCEGQFSCESCLIETRDLLSGIELMYLELPSHLGHLHGSLTYGARSNDGHPLPGGDVLVMLAGGSEGLRDAADTVRDGDPPAIEFELGWWALGWSDRRQEQANDTALLLLAGSPTRQVVRAVAYLSGHCRWAARNHDGFATFHADMRRLHQRLEHATGRGLPVEKANADCFDCGGALIRTANRHTGVLDDQSPVTCRDCGQEYDPARYRLALKEAWEKHIQGWVPLTTAASLSGRSVETVETWAKRGQVTTSCRVEDGRKLVWWPDLQDRLEVLEQARVLRAARLAEREAS